MHCFALFWYNDVTTEKLWHWKIISIKNEINCFSPAFVHIHYTLAQGPTIPPPVIPSSHPLWVHLSIYLPVLATRSHLVAQQHDDHILLGVFMNLCQPCLEMEIEQRVVKKFRTGEDEQEKRVVQRRQDWSRGGIEDKDYWQRRRMNPLRRRKGKKRLICWLLLLLHLVLPFSLLQIVPSLPLFSFLLCLSIHLLPITGQRSLPFLLAWLKSP